MDMSKIVDYKSLSMRLPPRAAKPKPICCFYWWKKKKAAFQTAIEVMIFFDTQKWY